MSDSTIYQHQYGLALCTSHCTSTSSGSLYTPFFDMGCYGIPTSTTIHSPLHYNPITCWYYQTPPPQPLGHELAHMGVHTPCSTYNQLVVEAEALINYAEAVLKGFRLEIHIFYVDELVSWLIICEKNLWHVWHSLQPVDEIGYWTLTGKSSTWF